MQGTKQLPQRMCACCKQLKPKDQLIRLVKTDEGTVLDETLKVNGRGLYVCRTGECVKHLLKNKKFAQKHGFDFSEELKSQMEKLIEQ